MIGWLSPPCPVCLSTVTPQQPCAGSPASALVQGHTHVPCEHVCDDFPSVCVNRFRHPYHVQYTSLAHTGTAAARGTHTQQTPCAASLSGLQLLQEGLFHRAPGSSCACTGQVTTVSVEGAGKWSGHPSGPSWLGKLRPAAMSSVPHLFLLHPSIQLHSRGVVMVLGVLSATSPCPLPTALGFCTAQRHMGTGSGKPAHCNHPPETTCFRAQPSSHG